LISGACVLQRKTPQVTARTAADLVVRVAQEGLKLGHLKPRTLATRFAASMPSPGRFQPRPNGDIDGASQQSKNV
jgi:hypothetical protein